MGSKGLKACCIFCSFNFHTKFKSKAYTPPGIVGNGETDNATYFALGTFEIFCNTKLFQFVLLNHETEPQI